MYIFLFYINLIIKCKGININGTFYEALKWRIERRVLDNIRIITL